MKGALVGWVIGCVIGMVCIAAVGAPEAPPAVTLTSTPLAYARAAIGDRPGAVSIGLWRDGKASFAGLRDGVVVPADEVGGPNATLFEIGSISKVFTGVLLAQAVERGELSLDDTLGKLLEGKVGFASDKVAAVTLRQLVTHTACLPRLPANLFEGANNEDPYAHYDRAQLWKALAALQVTGTPPCDAAYSNLGLGLLGDLLAMRFERPWETLVRERIAGPLGMRDTVVTLGDKATRLAPGFAATKPASNWAFDALVGAGGLRSTPADMLSFGRAILAGRDGPLGGAAERVVTPLARFGDGAIGYAMQVRGPAGKRSFSHDGATGGYRAQLMLAADTGDVLVVLASNAGAPVARLAAELAAARYPVEAAVPGVEANCLAECAGVYRVDKQAALTQLGIQPRFAVYAVAGQPDRFAYDIVEAELQFERNEAGTVVALVLHQNGRQRAPKIDPPA